ncbi:MAG: hypothetical protein IIC12_08625 [Proteobacteria bacterium]|nr:hypothetical protein [Pseudomonadota bacterium]
MYALIHESLHEAVARAGAGHSNAGPLERHQLSSHVFSCGSESCRVKSTSNGVTVTKPFSIAWKSVPTPESCPLPAGPTQNIVRHYGGEKAVDAVVANNNIPDGPTPAGLRFIRVNKPWDDDVLLVEADVIDETDETTTARHDPVKLANAIAEAYRKSRGRRRRLPRVRLNLESKKPGTDRQVLNRKGEAEPHSVQEKPVGR